MTVQNFCMIRQALCLPVCLGPCVLIIIHGILGIVDHSGPLTQSTNKVFCVMFLVSLGPVSSSKHQANFLKNMPVLEGRGEFVPWEVP